MSLFSWFSRKPGVPHAAKPQPDSSGGLARVDATRPLLPARPGVQRPAPEPAPPEAPGSRKAERLERRELLYGVVREAMVRAGVLSASYKFKVLSLDPTGRQYLVMMDLAREFGGESARLSDIEVLIAQTAKARHELRVTAVYWRLNEGVSVASRGVAPALRAGAAAPTRPVVALGDLSGPARPIERRATPRYEPIDDDEVAAFKRALATTRPAAAPGHPPGTPEPAAGETVRSGRRGTAPPVDDSGALPLESRPQELSTTQYGDLQ